MDPIEIIAAVFGFVCVVLVVRQNIWCWPTGLVQVALYVYVFLQAKLYSDVVLHVIYVILQFYGWHQWLHGGKDRKELPVSQLSRTSLARWVAVAGVGTLVWGWLMSRTDAALPYWDGFILVASLIAQWLMAWKRLESWLFWIVVDVVAVGVYYVKGLYPTCGLYAVFLMLATAGFIAWGKDLKSPGETLPAS